MRLLAAAIVLAWAAQSWGEASFDELAAASDLVIAGQVLQAGELEGVQATTIAIDRQLRGMEAAGAVTFRAGGWRVGERSVFFLRRLPLSDRGARFASIADPATSLAASAGFLRSEPVRSASYRREELLPEGSGISLPGVAAGLIAAFGILALAKLRRPPAQKKREGRSAS